MSVQLIKGPGYCYFAGTDGNSYGLTPQGFVSIPMTEFVKQLQNDYQVTFGQNIDLSANQPDGQRIAMESEALTLVVELIKAAYDSRFPDTAQGQSLANVCSITNFTPEPPTFSTVTATVSGTAGIVIPDIFQASVQGSSVSVFQVLAGQSYAVGPSGTVNIIMVALEAGPVAAPAGTLTVLVTPVAGISSITNTDDAALGADLETETQIRQRRIRTLAQPGPNLDQIITTLLETVGITNAGGLENDTDVTDSSGLPPHSVALLVQGTTLPQDIANTIYKTKSAGIQTYGTNSAVVTSSQGQQVVISYSVPTGIETYYDITYLPATNPLDGVFPANGATAIQNAVLAYLGLQVVGQDVIIGQLQSFIIDQVPGIIGLTIKAGTSPAPGSTSNIPILYYQLALSRAANISVHT